MLNFIKRYISIFSITLSFFCFFRVAYALDYQSKADEHYLKGQILYDRGRYKEAQDEFRKAIKLIKENEEKKQTSTISKETEEEKLKVKKEKADIIFKRSIEYVIGEADVLLIKVWQNDDLTDEVIVRPDGMISFPLAGELKAKGFTIREFKRNLTEALKEYIKYPRVSVSIRKMGGRRVIILGQVRGPGVYSVTGRKTILEAVGLAGGFTDDAVTTSVILVRGGLANPKPQRLDLNKALKLADLSDNLILESEDIIFVPRRFIADVNYFLKLILDPVSRGLYSVREIRDW